MCIYVSPIWPVAVPMNYQTKCKLELSGGSNGCSLEAKTWYFVHWIVPKYQNAQFFLRNIEMQKLSEGGGIEVYWQREGWLRVQCLCSLQNCFPSTLDSPPWPSSVPTTSGLSTPPPASETYSSPPPPRLLASASPLRWTPPWRPPLSRLWNAQSLDLSRLLSSQLSESSLWAPYGAPLGREMDDGRAAIKPLCLIDCPGGRENSAAEIKLVWGSGESGRQRWSAGGARCGETLAPLQLPLLACRDPADLRRGGSAQAHHQWQPAAFETGHREDDLFKNLLPRCWIWVKFILLYFASHQWEMTLNQDQDGIFPS